MNITTAAADAGLNSNMKDTKSFVLSDDNSWIIHSFTIAYLLEFHLCVIGNGLELYILPRIKQADDYIHLAFCALAFSDFLQGIISMPKIMLVLTFDDWFLGDFLCKFMLYFIFVSRMNGIWTLVYIAFDRFMNACYPLQFVSFKGKRFCSIAMFSIFIGNSIICFYAFLYSHSSFNKHLNMEQCFFDLPSESLFIYHHLYMNIIYMFTLPVALIVLFYFFIIRKFLIVKSMKFGKKLNVESIEFIKNESANCFILKILFFLVVLFILFNFPYVLIKTCPMDSSVHFTRTNEEKYDIWMKLVFFMQTINSSLNPWIYFIFSKPFRNEVKQIISGNKINKNKQTNAVGLFFLFSYTKTPSMDEEINRFE